MGHNAKIGEHNAHWNSSVEGKDGVGERARAGIMHAGADLSSFISNGADFDYLTDMDTNSNNIEVNREWLNKVKDYFIPKENVSFYNFLFDR